MHAAVLRRVLLCLLLLLILILLLYALSSLRVQFRVLFLDLIHPVALLTAPSSTIRQSLVPILITKPPPGGAPKKKTKAFGVQGRGRNKVTYVSSTFIFLALEMPSSNVE